MSNRDKRRWQNIALPWRKKSSGDKKKKIQQTITDINEYKEKSRTVRTNQTYGQ